MTDMNRGTDNVLGEACRLVSVLQVAGELGYDGLKLGANRSPFREDRKPSFAVIAGGHGFIDYASGDKGGCWKFVQLARPEWSKGDVANFIIGLSGLEPGERKRPGKRALAEARRARRLRAFEDARAGWVPRPVEPTPVWADALRDRFLEGVDFLTDDAASAEEALKLALWRGWPARWVEELAMMGKLGFPWEPWARGHRRAAFLVERPEKEGSAVLVPCGYHQRYFNFNEGKDYWDWRFRPSEALDGVSCRPYPFVLGDLTDPAVVVIHEGQWDAATWWGAAGLFDGADLGESVVCFGLRGARSIDLFLSVYGAWLAEVRPRVWLINDADEAGREFHSPVTDKAGRVTPSFSDRLYKLGCERVVNSEFNWPGIKDFNDAYRAAPSAWGPNQIYELMVAEGLLG